MQVPPQSIIHSDTAVRARNNTENSTPLSLASSKGKCRIKLAGFLKHIEKCHLINTHKPLHQDGNNKGKHGSEGEKVNSYTFYLSKNLNCIGILHLKEQLKA